jgi:hypothetical protein
MKFEVVEQSDAWVVRRDGVELARYADQHHALTDVSERLRAREADDDAVSLVMRYAPRQE